MGGTFEPVAKKAREIWPNIVEIVKYWKSLPKSKQPGAKYSRVDQVKFLEDKTFKAKTIQRLSLSSKLYCLSHSRASRTQKFFLSANHGGRQYFSVFRGSCTVKSISPALFKGCLPQTLLGSLLNTLSK